MLKFKTFFIVLLLFSCTHAFAQREAGIWYFGYEAGLDFNSGEPVAITNSKMITEEGCASISDYKGNLLFYTDGSTVWNKDHNIMSNGSGLLGHRSSTQSALIVPNPTNRNIYYIFTIDQPDPRNADGNPLTNKDDGVNDGLNYTEVNMTLEGGLGAVNPTKKNIHLVTYNPSNKIESAFKASEKITAVKHHDDNSIWVITHFIDKFFTFKVTGSGVNTTPQETLSEISLPTGGYLFNAIGFLKSSPNGKKLGIVHQSTRKTNEPNPKGGIVRNTGKVVVYDFDNLTGEISNPIIVMSGKNPYGIEFSPKTKKMYITDTDYDNGGIFLGSTLYQFNLESSNIPTSKVKIESTNYTAGALQLAIDEKIYVSGYSIPPGYSMHLSVIDKPELTGNACNFKFKQITFDSKKVLRGLPTFIQSLFLFNFNCEHTCLGDSTHFSSTTFETVDSYLWDFGDGTTSTEVEPYHIYNLPGTYTATLIKTINGDTKDPLVKTVEIKDKPVILNTTHQLVQCDSYDSNPNDELAMFNLSSSIDAITLNNSEDYNVFFYLDDDKAISDSLNQNSLPDTYRNSTPNQLITAKIVYQTSNCYSLGKVELIANSSILISPENLAGCDLGDGIAEFNLEFKKSEIISNLGLPSNLDIYFYPTEEDVINNTNRLPKTYVSEEKTIYFRAELNGVCYGAGKFDFIINSFPNIDLNETFYVCKDNFPFEISATIPSEIKNNYNYNWSNGKATESITVSTPQEISVEIIDKNTNCTKIKTILINQVNVPIITDVQINISIPSATVLTNTNFENQYFLNNPNGTSQTGGSFSNIEPGTHTVFVIDKYNCGVSKKRVFVFGFPKFFSPNYDGINDSWGVKGLNSDEFSYSYISIFDRFGKHLINLKPQENWDGNYNNKPLPSSDYWFHLSITNINGSVKVYKGHFSLLR